MYAQSQHEKPEMFSDDPLRQLTRAFPRSIEFKNQGHLIEFCPHNTCDAFSAAASVSERSLEDLAYLYEFYYSGFIYLEDWRAGDEGKADAEQVFAKPEYRHRLPEGGRSAAPCVIEEIGGGGRVRLLFIRYDEHRRNVVPLNLIRELSRAN
jgi:hypothetical protein